MTYEWQNGDYILTEGMTEEEYHEVARLWMDMGVKKGEYPNLGWFWDNPRLERFGVFDGGLYHGRADGTLKHGRRVDLVHGRLQVADEEPEQAPERTPGGRPMRLTIEIPGTITVQALGDALDALEARVVGVHGGDDV